MEEKPKRFQYAACQNKALKKDYGVRELQPLSYFETFWCFNKFSFHHKWNDGQLLLINMVYTSCLMSSQTI